MNKYINVAIAGATGYIGIELIKLLIKHPKVKIKNICAQTSIGKSISKFEPSLKKKSLPKITNLNTKKSEELFYKSGKNLKVAIVSYLKNMSFSETRKILDENKGFLIRII